MKKLMLLAVLVVGPLRPAHADVLSPPDQLLLTLSQHVVGITEFTTHGQTKLEFIDGLIQLGHYKNDYILAFDGGFCNNTEPDKNGRLATTWGVHAHVLSGVNSYFNISPSMAMALEMLELTPRYSYDTDVHHGVFGVTFGARIPFN